MGMWIERDRRREAIPPDDQELSALAPCLRGLVLMTSLAWDDPAAEFGVEAGEGPETLSQDMVACLRITPGLEEDSEAARSPGEEEE